MSSLPTSLSNSSSRNNSLAKSPRTSSKKRSSMKRESKKQQNVDKSTQNALTQLKHTIENLERRQDKLEEQINRSDARAREYQKANNKQAAIQSLKKKKALEQQLQQLDVQIMNVEGKLQTLENAQTNLLVYRNSMTARDSIQRLNKQVSVDEIEEVFMECEKQNDFADEVGRVIGRGDSGAYDDGLESDDDLLAELERLEMEECSPSSIMPTA